MAEQNNILNLALFENFDIFTGRNKYFTYPVNRRIFFLHSQKDVPYQDFLNDIIKATKISEEDYSVISVPEGYVPATGQFFDDQNCETIIFFGFNHRDAGLPEVFKYYQSIPLRGKKLMLADDLGKIHNDKNLKSMLWKSLKEIFNIS